MGSQVHPNNGVDTKVVKMGQPSPQMVKMGSRVHSNHGVADTKVLKMRRAKVYKWVKWAAKSIQIMAHDIKVVKMRQPSLQMEPA